MPDQRRTRADLLPASAKPTHSHISRIPGGLLITDGYAHASNVADRLPQCVTRCLVERDPVPVGDETDDSPLSKLKRIDGVDARFSDDHIALSVFSFDSEMLVTPHLSSLLGHESPMFHLHRMGDDGLYDRFAGHVSTLWESGRPVWE
ncbi:hypothetical protein GCM10009575_052140 [Streptomyces rhizosphaericus]|uniref:Uncharacterized protein n=1 Tax=Streptomyces rhizosphaericus TaxID=114699 RepID=A0ABP4AMV7_9ACTN